MGSRSTESWGDASRTEASRCAPRDARARNGAAPDAIATRRRSRLTSRGSRKSRRRAQGSSSNESSRRGRNNASPELEPSLPLFVGGLVDKFLWTVGVTPNVARCDRRSRIETGKCVWHTACAVVRRNEFHAVASDRSASRDASEVRRCALRRRTIAARTCDKTAKSKTPTSTSELPGIGRGRRRTAVARGHGPNVRLLRDRAQTSGKSQRE